MKKIRFGVIGCGSIANEYHLPALRRVEGAQLVWACDLIEERAQKAKDDFGFEKYTLDYHDILNDSSIDAVCIFTKIEMHATLCIEAAAAGKHIFSQKPFAYNIEEGRKIIRAVDEAGVKLTPSFMHSYMDGSIVARRIVEEGKIGEIRHIRMRNATKNPFDSAPGYGGCMMDLGGHGMEPSHTGAGAPLGGRGSLGLPVDLGVDALDVVHLVVLGQALKDQRQLPIPQNLHMVFGRLGILGQNLRDLLGGDAEVLRYLMHSVFVTYATQIEPPPSL